MTKPINAKILRVYTCKYMYISITSALLSATDSFATNVAIQI